MGWYQDGSTPVKEQAVKEEGRKGVSEQALEEHAHPLKNDQVSLLLLHVYFIDTHVSGGF